jgi:hypothetical protein
MINATKSSSPLSLRRGISRVVTLHAISIFHTISVPLPLPSTPFPPHFQTSDGLSSQQTETAPQPPSSPCSEQKQRAARTTTHQRHTISPHRTAPTPHLASSRSRASSRSLQDEMAIKTMKSEAPTVSAQTWPPRATCCNSRVTLSLSLSLSVSLSHSLFLSPTLPLSLSISHS